MVTCFINKEEYDKFHADDKFHAENPVFKVACETKATQMMMELKKEHRARMAAFDAMHNHPDWKFFSRRLRKAAALTLHLKIGEEYDLQRKM